jgi:hypothetical protein
MRLEDLQRAYTFFNNRVWDGALPSAKIIWARESDMPNCIMQVGQENKNHVIEVNADRAPNRTDEFLYSSLGHEMGHIHIWSPDDGHDEAWSAGMREKDFDVKIWYNDNGKRRATTTPLKGGVFDRALQQFMGTAMSDTATSVAPYVPAERQLPPSATEQMQSARELLRAARTHADVLAHVGHLGDRLYDVEDELHRVASTVDYLKAHGHVITNINDNALRHFDTQQKLHREAKVARGSEREFYQRALSLSDRKIDDETNRYFSGCTENSARMHNRLAPAQPDGAAVEQLAVSIDNWGMQIQRPAPPASRTLVFSGPQPWDR